MPPPPPEAARRHPHRRRLTGSGGATRAVAWSTVARPGEYEARLNGTALVELYTAAPAPSGMRWYWLLARPEHQDGVPHRLAQETIAARRPLLTLPRCRPRAGLLRGAMRSRRRRGPRAWSCRQTRSRAETLAQQKRRDEDLPVAPFEWSKMTTRRVLGGELPLPWTISSSGWAVAPARRVTKATTSLPARVRHRSPRPRHGLMGEGAASTSPGRRVASATAASPLDPDEGSGETVMSPSRPAVHHRPPLARPDSRPWPPGS